MKEAEIDARIHHTVMPKAMPTYLVRANHHTTTMTEEEKRRVIADLLARAATAERSGLSHTAKGWRNHAFTVESKPANEMILARPIGDFDISELMRLVAGSSQ